MQNVCVARIRRRAKNSAPKLEYYLYYTPVWLGLHGPGRVPPYPTAEKFFTDIHIHTSRIWLWYIQIVIFWERYFQRSIFSCIDEKRSSSIDLVDRPQRETKLKLWWSSWSKNRNVRSSGQWWSSLELEGPDGRGGRGVQPMSAGGEIKTRLYEAIDISGAGTKEVLAQLVLSGISWPGRPMWKR